MFGDFERHQGLESRVWVRGDSSGSSSTYVRPGLGGRKVSSRPVSDWRAGCRRMCADSCWWSRSGKPASNGTVDKDLGSICRLAFRNRRSGKWVEEEGECRKRGSEICSDAGGRDCRVKFTYKNQCATAAVSNAGAGGTFYSAAATKEEAAGLSLAQCRAASKQSCEVVISNCTEPEFEKF